MIAALRKVPLLAVVGSIVAIASLSSLSPGSRGGARPPAIRIVAPAGRQPRPTRESESQVKARDGGAAATTTMTTPLTRFVTFDGTAGFGNQMLAAARATMVAREMNASLVWQPNCDQYRTLFE